MSHRERSAWAELAVTGAVWGWYFWVLVAGARSGAIAEQGFIGAMGVTLATAMLLSIVVAIGSSLLVEVTARRTRRGAHDEREAWAGLRATRFAHGLLIVLILGLAAAGFGFGSLGGAGMIERAAAAMSNGLVLFANGAVAALVLAEMAHYAALIVFLRGAR